MGFWEQLPYTNFHDLNLTELVKFVNETIKKINEMSADIVEQNQEIEDFKRYVQDYLDNLDIEGDVRDYINYLIDTDQLSPSINRIAYQQDINFNNTMVNRVFLCMSDSYGLTPDTTTSWIGRLKQYIGADNDHFFRTEYNGSGFYGVDPNHTYLDQITTLAGTMTDDQKNSVTDVIIGGGYNDATALRNGVSDTLLRSSINDTLYYIENTFPNAKIRLFCPAWGIVTGHTNQHSYIRAVINLYTQAVGAPRRSYISDVNWLHRQVLLDNTNYHPNATGAYCIAKSIASVLNGGDVACDLAPDPSGVNGGMIVPQITPNGSNVSNFSWQNPYMTYRNGICTFGWNKITFTLTSQLTDMDQREIGEFTDGIMSGGTQYYHGYNGIAWTSNNSTKYSLLIYNNKLRLVNSSGATIPANTTIEILYGSMSGDCML